jgi:hypothetical protein
VAAVLSVLRMFAFVGVMILSVVLAVIRVLGVLIVVVAILLSAGTAAGNKRKGGQCQP